MQMVDIGASDAGVRAAPDASAAVWLAAGVSALGGLLFGYDWVVIGGAKPFYEARFGLVAPTDGIRAASAASPRRSLAAVIAEPRFRRALLIGVVLAVPQQWCGINVIFNYVQEIFAGAGYAVSDTLFNIVITGVVNCLFTFLALATVERWGRRRLLLLGCGGLALIYAAVGASYVAHVQGWLLLLLLLLLLVAVAIAVYAVTLAPMTWVALSEIFPGEARGASMAVATTALWAACFLLTYSFPLLNAAAGTGVTFWLYGAVCGGCRRIAVESPCCAPSSAIAAQDVEGAAKGDHHGRSGGQSALRQMRQRLPKRIDGGLCRHGQPLEGRPRDANRRSRVPAKPLSSVVTPTRAIALVTLRG